jgi:hypothetical protein
MVIMIRQTLSKLFERHGERLFKTKPAVKMLKSAYQLYESSLELRNTIPRITVFRGIPQDHPRYHLALQGIVIPRDFLGIRNIQAHNYGSSKSALTSWTRTKTIAETYAEPEGVVLEATVPGNRLLWSPDIWYENEVLMAGIVCNAQVHLISKPPNLISPPPPEI